MSYGIRRESNHGPGARYVLDYLKQMQADNSAFFFACQDGNDHSGGNIFWADSTCRMNYSCFGDTVRVDTSYRANPERLPFITFTGLNHHHQLILFGCALLFNESDTAFVWLLQTWLRAMSGSFPLSITTDPDRLIRIAVTQVLPNTRHRLCKWSVLRESHDKLAHVYRAHPTLETEFKKCISVAESAEEFESSWGSLLDRYSIKDNPWLQSMYSLRHMWVPIYTRETFFGEFSTDECSEDEATLLDSDDNAATTVQSLIKLYEKAVKSWHEQELKADIDTINTLPVLKTPSPMEKQAANLYTRRIFIKFQEELVETLANPATRVEDSETSASYRVAKFGEEHKAHTVRFSSAEMKAECSCRMFEFSGIICRHVLSVFRTKNVLILPSHYVMKRWTREARSGAIAGGCASELPIDSRESSTVRYNNLRQEAIKFVEEGAKSILTYNVAMEALQDAAKRVAASKRPFSGVNQGEPLSNGCSQDIHPGEEHAGKRYLSSDEKERKIHELTTELDTVNNRCEVYRANLLAILRDMEDQKSMLSIKVQNARLSLKQ